MFKPSPLRATLTRRAALGLFAAGTTVGLVGCTVDAETSPEDRREDPGTGSPRLDPDVTLATLTVAISTKAVELVTATRTRHGDLAALLTPVITSHEEHIQVLDEAADVPQPSSSPSPSGAVSPGASGSAAPATQVPRNPRRAMRNLVTFEQELGTQVKRHAFNAQSGQFARLLASMSAAAAQHVALLTQAEAALGRERQGRR